MFARACVGSRYPEHVAVRRSVNGGTGACLFYCNSRHGSFYAREFLSKIKHKFVNNSCSN